MKDSMHARQRIARHLVAFAAMAAFLTPWRPAFAEATEADGSSPAPTVETETAASSTAESHQAYLPDSETRLREQIRTAQQGPKLQHDLAGASDETSASTKAEVSSSDAQSDRPVIMRAAEAAGIQTRDGLLALAGMLGLVVLLWGLRVQVNEQKRVAATRARHPARAPQETPNNLAAAFRSGTPTPTVQEPPRAAVAPREPAPRKRRTRKKVRRHANPSGWPVDPLLAARRSDLLIRDALQGIQLRAESARGPMATSTPEAASSQVEPTIARLDAAASAADDLATAAALSAWVNPVDSDALETAPQPSPQPSPSVESVESVEAPEIDREDQAMVGASHHLPKEETPKAKKLPPQPAMSEPSSEPSYWTPPEAESVPEPGSVPQPVSIPDPESIFEPLPEAVVAPAAEPEPDPDPEPVTDPEPMADHVAEHLAGPAGEARPPERVAASAPAAPGNLESMFDDVLTTLESIAGRLQQLETKVQKAPDGEESGRTRERRKRRRRRTDAEAPVRSSGGQQMAPQPALAAVAAPSGGSLPHTLSKVLDIAGPGDEVAHSPITQKVVQEKLKSITSTRERVLYMASLGWDQQRICGEAGIGEKEVSLILKSLFRNDRKSD